MEATLNLIPIDTLRVILKAIEKQLEINLDTIVNDIAYGDSSEQFKALESLNYYSFKTIEGLSKKIELLENQCLEFKKEINIQ